MINNESESYGGLNSTSKTQTSTAKFEEFFVTYYKETVFEILENYPNERTLVVDCKLLDAFDIDLAELLIEKPEEVIEAAQIAIKNIDPLVKDANINIRFKNMPHAVDIKSLDSRYIGTMINITGILVAVEEPSTRIETGIFECRGCMRLHDIEQTSRTYITEPSLCSECGGRSFRLLQEESRYIDTQTFRLKFKDTSRELILILEDDLCDHDKYKVGQMVNVTGIYKTFHETSSKKFKNYIFGNYLELSDDYISDLEEEININPGRNSAEYNSWRNKVISRDKVCRCCGADKEKYLEAHHIFSWEDYPELRFDEDNGVTLCKWCHRKYNSFMGHKGTGIGIINFLTKFGTASRISLSLNHQDINIKHKQKGYIYEPKEGCLRVVDPKGCGL